MTLRQFWVRIRALPQGSPLHIAEDRAAAQTEADRRVAEVEDALNRYR